MNPAIQSMLVKYRRETVQDNINAFREIFQEIALLGLWRSKFFEQAAFYGGTALRVLYQLDRFSEDLDFSLLKPDPAFDLSPYLPYIENELAAWGFRTEVVRKEKSKVSAIESAFLKGGTIEQLIQIEVKDPDLKSIAPGHLLKIKIEVDINPPSAFKTETQFLLLPIPFSVRVYTLSTLFAGKTHAVLFRHWKNRVKGRDWYDLLWYIGRNTPLDLNHLRERMIQSGHLTEKEIWNADKFKKILRQRIEDVDFEKAKKDVAPFLNHPESIEIWSKEFFKSLEAKIVFSP